MSSSQIRCGLLPKKMIAIFICVGITIIMDSDGFGGIRGKVFNIKKFGAIDDGRAVNTEAINKAIHAASAAGGGTVLIPSGRWFSGKIHLKNNVRLKISKKASLIPESGSLYHEPEGSINTFIFGDSLVNIEISGGGVIEGKTGLTWENDPDGIGRNVLGLRSCKNVKIKDLRIRQGGGCAIVMVNLDSLEMDNVKVESFFNKSPEFNQDKDAIDLDGCQHVYIHHCDFQASEDAMVFASRGTGLPTVSRYVVIEKCTFRSRTGTGIQFGPETQADIRFIQFSDIIIEHAGNAGIGITLQDSAMIDNIIFRGVLMRNVCTPFFISVTNRGKAGKIRNIQFENVTAMKISAIVVYSRRSPQGYWVSAINGLEDAPVENIVFKNVVLHYPGGGSLEHTQITPPDPVFDTQPRSLGMRPAGGFYIRHARGIEFYNLRISYSQEEHRPSMVFDDVKGVLLNRVRFQRAPQLRYDVVLRNVSGLSVRKSKRIQISEDRLPVLDSTRSQ